jgi:DNA-binding response OmpR family regulator
MSPHSYTFLMTQRTVVVVEDEAMIAAAVAARLSAEGFRVETAHDGPSGVELCNRIRPDLVLLDIMLPGFDGLEVCRRIQRDRAVPILMLTARDSETDVLVGLGIGADDYMTKPFSPRELVARVKALLRRVDRAHAGSDAEVLRSGDIDVHPARRLVMKAGERVHLTPLEFDLMCRFLERPARVFTREQLLGDIWGYADDAGARTVDSHVASLRRKLGSEAVRTVHGVGYALGENE